jgi:hypothetical protein
MNALLDRFPTAVEIDGCRYELNTDYRVGLKIMLAYEDPELVAAEQQAVMLQLLYKEIPSNIQRAAELATRFLDCGEEHSIGAQGDGGSRFFSWTKDAKYIYSAIKQTHGIDLETVDYLHWWKFVFLFMDLNENCFFNRIIYYRSRRQQGKLTPEEREFCASIADILELPQILDAEEQGVLDDFYDQLN